MNYPDHITNSITELKKQYSKDYSPLIQNDQWLELALKEQKFSQELQKLTYKIDGNNYQIHQDDHHKIKKETFCNAHNSNSDNPIADITARGHYLEQLTIEYIERYSKELNNNNYNHIQFMENQIADKLLKINADTTQTPKIQAHIFTQAWNNNFPDNQLANEIRANDSKQLSALIEGKCNKPLAEKYKRTWMSGAEAAAGRGNKNERS